MRAALSAGGHTGAAANASLRIDEHGFVHSLLVRIGHIGRIGPISPILLAPI